MRFSLATIALVPSGQTVRASREERQRIFDWTAQTGFAGIELSPQWLSFDALRLEVLNELREDVFAAGLVVSGLNINRCLVAKDSHHEPDENRLCRAMDAAAVLEAPLLTISLSMPYPTQPRPNVRGSEFSESERARAAEVVTQLAERAARLQMALSLELHDDGLLETPEWCLDMLRRVEATNVGVNPDLGNLIRTAQGADWKRALVVLAAFANNWHVKNYRSGQPVPVWDGQIDYAVAFEIMRQARYAGWVSIEGYFGDPLDVQAKSLAYLQSLIKQGSAA